MPLERDIDLMARTVWGEARGEGTQGMLAVAWVIWNRASQPKWWGRNIEEVCLKPYQFSCWNKDDPNKEKLEKITLDDLGFARAYYASLAVLLGELPDITRGSTHYFNPRAATPKWAEGKQAQARIGKHLFYLDVDKE